MRVNWRTPGRTPRAGLRLALVLALCLLASGCGAIRFHRAWSSYEPVAEATGMEGRWKGEWRSEWNGHSGGLRCLMTPREEEGCYRAWFFSTYAGILFFQYQTEFRLDGSGSGSLTFAGEQDLGKVVGGVYRYEGTIVADSFHATYRADNGDHGVFEMRRVD